MKTLNRTALGLAAALALSACGGRAAPQAVNPSAAAAGSTSGNPSFTGGTGTSEGYTENPTPANIGTPAESYAFTITGNGGTDPEFETPEVYTADNLLRVKITPAGASNISLASGIYSAFSGGYGCIKYNVTVLGRTVTTQVLAVKGADNQACPNAPKSQIIDFSGRLTPGHGPAIVKIDQASSSTYCERVLACMQNPWASPQCKYNYPAYLQGSFCPTKTMYMNYTGTGTVEVQVNGTSFAEGN